MPRLPDEDYESFRRSYGDVYAMEPEQLQLGISEGAEGFCHGGRGGRLRGRIPQEDQPYEVLYTRDLPYADMIRLKAVEEMTEVLQRTGSLLHTLRQLAKEFDDPFDLYAALGDYYENHGLSAISHTRITDGMIFCWISSGSGLPGMHRRLIFTGSC